MNEFAQVLVVGCGRGGTCLGFSVIEGLGIKCSDYLEDRNFFNYNKLPSNYGTKLATENKVFTQEALSINLDNNENLKIIFMIRHPYDVVMSKILRGQPKSMGGDNSSEEVMPDGTYDGAVKALIYMYSILNFVKDKYPSRVMVVKMEDLILNIEKVDEIAKFIGMTKPDNFKLFSKHKYHKKRYGNNLDNTQINLFQNINDNFDGYFSDKKDVIEKIKNRFRDLARAYNYDI